MAPNVLTEFSLCLPRIAEEGGDVESVDEPTLIKRLARAAGDESGARAIVVMVRRVFQALALLDERQLDAGRWQMVSFPALLLARSLLSGFGDDRFQLLEKGFWDASDFLIDRQRSVLRGTEQRRSQASDSAQPIRRVWVSWALLSLDGRFLLVRREDAKEHRDGSRGQFVFPGGRVTSADLGKLSLAERLAFFDPGVHVGDSSVSAAAFESALRRELHEELELDASAVSHISSVEERFAYTALEGAKSAHAITQYVIQMFRVALTDSGKNALVACLARQPNRFGWFAVNELADGKNAAGETAFVDALINQFSASLPSVVDAAASDVVLGVSRPIADSMDIPISIGEPLLIGSTGHERAVMLDLSEDALQLLGVLAAVRRGDPISGVPEGVSIAPGTGWVLIDDPDILASVRSLSNSIASVQGERLIAFQGDAVRLNSRSADQVFFSSSALATGITDERRGKSYRLRMVRCRISSRLGTADAVDRETRVTEKLGGAIYGLTQGDPAAALGNLDTIKRVQRIQLRAFLDAVGARLLVREVDGVPELAATGRLGA